MSTLNSDAVDLPSITEPDAWESIIPFDEFETPEISACLLPGPLNHFAEALAHETETSESLVVMTILGVISVTSAKCYTVNPKSGWAEPINIYTVIALPPANNKSLVLKRCTQPLIDWENAQEQKLLPEIQRCKSQRKTEEKIIEGMRKKAAMANDQLEQKDLSQKIIEAETNLTTISIIPQLFANDSTTESLVNSTHEQNGRFAIFSDEGGILETLSGLYNNGNSNIDIILKGIDGGELRVRRKDRSFNLNPYLTIVLTIQPSIIQTMSTKRSYIGNGTLERFLYVIPKSKLGFRSHNTPPTPPHLIAQYGDVISLLLQNDNHKGAPQPLTLSNDALNSWYAFRQEIELELRPEGTLSPCQGWGGKICGFALRIAGLLHIGQGKQNNCIIDNDTMEKAIYIAQLLCKHARAAFTLMGCDQAVQDAKEIYNWITLQKRPSFTRTELYNTFRNQKFGRKDRLNKAINILIERNILSDPVEVPTKKPTIRYYVNPSLIREK